MNPGPATATAIATAPRESGGPISVSTTTAKRTQGGTK